MATEFNFSKLTYIAAIDGSSYKEGCDYLETRALVTKDADKVSVSCRSIMSLLHPTSKRLFGFFKARAALLTRPLPGKSQHRTTVTI